MQPPIHWFAALFYLVCECKWVNICIKVLWSSSSQRLHFWHHRFICSLVPLLWWRSLFLAFVFLDIASRHELVMCKYSGLELKASWNFRQTFNSHPVPYQNNPLPSSSWVYLFSLFAHGRQLASLGQTHFIFYATHNLLRLIAYCALFSLFIHISRLFCPRGDWKWILIFSKLQHGLVCRLQFLADFQRISGDNTAKVLGFLLLFMIYQCCCYRHTFAISIMFSL